MTPTNADVDGQGFTNIWSAKLPDNCDSDFWRDCVPFVAEDKSAKIPEEHCVYDFLRQETGVSDIEGDATPRKRNETNQC